MLGASTLRPWFASLARDALQIISAAVREPGASDRDRAELLAIALEIERLLGGSQREAA